METDKITPRASNSELIEALGVPTQLDLIFWAAITQSTIWAASTRSHATIFSAIWLLVAIMAGIFELATRLRKAP